MNWSDILQAGASLVTLGVVGWLVTWIYRLYRERERSLKQGYESKVELLEQRLKLKSEEVEREKDATRRYKVVVDEHKEYLERKLLDIQRKAGIAPDEPLPDKPIELSAELRHDIGAILSRLEQISIELPPPKGRTLLSRGTAYSATKQYEKAIKAYSEAIRLEPGLMPAYHNRGLARRNSGYLETALDDFSKVIELRPDMVEGYCNRGQTYMRLEKYERAIRDFNKVIEMDPEHVSAYWSRGASHHHLGQIEKAIEDFDEANRHEQDEPSRYYCQACAYSLMKKTDEAIASLKKAISLDKSYIEQANSDKDFDNIRDDPRFKTLLSQ